MGRWAMEAAAIVWLLLFKAHLLLILPGRLRSQSFRRAHARISGFPRMFALKEMDIISGIDLRGVNVLKFFKTIFKLLLYSICF